jgi:hypothetical protein
MSRKLPEIYQWYQHQDKGQQFCVTGIDMETRTIQVQNFDGSIDEYSFTEWNDLDVVLSSEPENWSGALDLDEPENLGTAITDTSKEDWKDPSREFHQISAENGDDYGEGFPVELPTAAAINAALYANTPPAHLTKAQNGVLREQFNASWYADYSEDPNSGLWRAEVYKHNVPEWCEVDLESLRVAMELARDFYQQA